MNPEPPTPVPPAPAVPPPPAATPQLMHTPASMDLAELRGALSRLADSSAAEPLDALARARASVERRHRRRTRRRAATFAAVCAALAVVGVPALWRAVSDDSATVEVAGPFSDTSPVGEGPGAGAVPGPTISAGPAVVDDFGLPRDAARVGLVPTTVLSPEKPPPTVSAAPPSSAAPPATVAPTTVAPTTVPASPPGTTFDHASPAPNPQYPPPGPAPTSPPTVAPPTTAPLATTPPTTERPREFPGAVGPGVIDDIRIRLGSLLGVSPSAIGGPGAANEAVTWNDGSLGCPAPGAFYTQALVPGARLRFTLGTRDLDVHLAVPPGGGASGVLCDAGSPRPI